MHGLSFIAKLSNNTIVVIDALSADEYQNGLAVFNELQDLKTMNTPQILRVCVATKRDLEGVFAQLASECSASGVRPIIHFEAHGSHGGIELRRSSTMEFVPWTELVPLLRRVNQACDYNLGVFMAACDGYTALKGIAIRHAAPYQFLLAPKTVVSAGLMRKVAISFYRELNVSANITNAFEVAAADEPFTLFLAEQFLAVTYAAVLKKQNIGKKAKQARTEQLTSMVPHLTQTPEGLRRTRELAREFTKPDPERFRAIQDCFLPGGCGFDFKSLVAFVREANEASRNRKMG
ncbi:hypothetical protein HZS91_00564 [Xanthomonas citri pv. citri]|uniref:hypothetical protein n=1 Tax=Xanthomonas citri TaxID=346 RepID=UPI001C63595D|nr:hypothetical protein [Xanthomonas citri]QYF33924.1 hypothetical protein HZS91_00564 [Xanthomonas citri pv. citri]